MGPSRDMSGWQNVSPTYHPRAIFALGRDLVTDDVVALMELVKNSYDAMAKTVRVRVVPDESFADLGQPVPGSGDLRSRPPEAEEEPSVTPDKAPGVEVEATDTAAPAALMLEVVDDGVGMTAETVRSVWCTIAEPYRASHPVGSRAGITRRASGEKGLGRLATARLGRYTEILTRSAGEQGTTLVADWRQVPETGPARKAQDAFVFKIGPLSEDLESETGTVVRIRLLSADWRDAKLLGRVNDELARLVSPFAATEGFGIVLETGDGHKPVTVSSPDFLRCPRYRLIGSVDDGGRLRGTYTLSDENGHSQEERRFDAEDLRHLLWEDVNAEELRTRTTLAPACGGFSFEFRAWDLDTAALGQLAAAHGLGAQRIRQSIRWWKGVSVYRDGVLVLPKGEERQDWLGLDLRRVSDLGPRLSTSQLVGYVTVSADTNPELRDASDREGLVDSLASDHFRRLVLGAVGMLEGERNRDRAPVERPAPIRDLLAGLSPAVHLREARDVVSEGGTARGVLAAFEKFESDAAANLSELGRRLDYYSRLATIGQMAGAIVHEIGNRSGTLWDLVRAAEHSACYSDMEFKKHVERARTAVRSLDRLNDRYGPLLARSRQTRRSNCDLSDLVLQTAEMKQQELKRHQIQCNVHPGTGIVVALDSGELVAVIYNLLDNAAYWLRRQPVQNRSLRVAAEKTADGRALVQVSDSGPGLTLDDSDEVFLPGVTTKPGGLGMGLAIAREIVTNAGGKITVQSPGDLGGCTFLFDVPLAREGGSI